MDRRSETSQQNGKLGGRPKANASNPALQAQELFYRGWSIKEISFLTKVPGSSLYRYASTWAKREIKVGISGYEANDDQIIQAVCRSLRLRPILVNLPFPKLLNALENSQVDVGMSSLSPTEDRQRKMYFTDSYSKERDPIHFYALKKAKIYSVNQIFKGSFGVVKGTLHETFIKSLGVKVKYFTNDNQLESGLRQGLVDCILSNRSPLSLSLREEISPVQSAFSLNYGLLPAMAISTGYQDGESIARAIEKLNADGFTQNLE